MSIALIAWIAANTAQAQDLPFSEDFNPADMTYKSDFFVNSTRHDPTVQEERLIVRVAKEGKRSGCTGFFVKNNQGKLYVGSARHCYDYQVTEACKNNKIRILPSGSMENKFIGTCKRLVVATPQDDLFIMEMNVLNSQGFPASIDLLKAIHNFYIPLKLTSYSSPAFFPLKMLGYPGDEYRNSKPTVSEDCYVLPDSAKLAIKAVPDQEIDPRYLAWQQSDKAEKSNKVETAAEDNLKLRIRKMNCSVYGGNSGGPIIIKDSLELLGLPRSYFPGLYNKIPENYAANFEEVKAFVTRNLKDIQANGIVVSSNPKLIGVDLTYLKRFNSKGTYINPDEACAIQLRTNLIEGKLITKYISNGANTCQKNGEEILWNCSPGPTKFCTFRNDESDGYWYIDEISPEKFNMTGGKGFKGTYIYSESI